MGTSSSKNKVQKGGKLVIGMNRLKDAATEKLQEAAGESHMLSVGNGKLSDLRMQLLKTGVIKIAITGPTEFDGIPKEMAMFNREFLPDLSRWCIAQGFELV
eukprot:gene24639-3002_t